VERFCLQEANDCCGILSLACRGLYKKLWIVVVWVALKITDRNRTAVVGSVSGLARHRGPFHRHHLPQQGGGVERITLQPDQLVYLILVIVGFLTASHPNPMQLDLKTLFMARCFCLRPVRLLHHGLKRGVLQCMNADKRRNVKV
jgi:hypothetical protein